ncbi:thiamin biosynthesis protein G (plastid) [Chondrus crispus]|uniref:Thiazole synthase n=1 Tax=Chondrus crispus TaxID=2769 RepID=M5DCS2_CHOCR|nr:thiamin biosynthesis protein G [Chondrus crispus]CCP38065.1 thiamin biosynthesis protein G [Chondrus crispus]|eukprot:YP_007627318.1 thiamin biosynthesis protein G (plastid) [Chondrus crispus]
MHKKTQSLSIELYKHNTPLILAGKSFTSRLMLGTGKYKSLQEAKDSIYISDTSIVTVAIRRAQHAKQLGKSNLIDALDWDKIWLLPNTAGCKTAEEAIRVAILGREMAKRLGQVDNNFVKLEVIPDPKYLLPDPIGTLKAAEYLIKRNFAVLPYINADPILAKQLENIGCASVMPLASPIGSGQGLQNTMNLNIIIENAEIPVIVDAGIGTASEAAKVMELGASAVLLNTAVANACSPCLMAESMKFSVLSGRIAYLAGRMQKTYTAQSSSPVEGISYIQ